MPLNYLEPKVAVDNREDGSIILSSPHPLAEGEAQLSNYLRHCGHIQVLETYF